MYPCAMAYRQILRDRNILDIECEVKESRIWLTVGHSQKMPTDNIAGEDVVFIQALGQPISRAGRRSREGTLGSLYLFHEN